MKQHKWHKEIKAWADGAEIEILWGDKWIDCSNPHWGENHNYRIKPQPKEPQYLYVYLTDNGIEFGKDKQLIQTKGRTYSFKYIGKIKLEVDDEKL